jgi:hypothetical protein
MREDRNGMWIFSHDIQTCTDSPIQRHSSLLLLYHKHCVLYVILERLDGIRDRPHWWYNFAADLILGGTGRSSCRQDSVRIGQVYQSYEQAVGSYCVISGGKPQSESSGVHSVRNG